MQKPTNSKSCDLVPLLIQWQDCLFVDIVGGSYDQLFEPVKTVLCCHLRVKMLSHPLTQIQIFIKMLHNFTQTGNEPHFGNDDNLTQGSLAAWSFPLYILSHPIKLLLHNAWEVGQVTRVYTNSLIKAVSKDEYLNKRQSWSLSW